MIILDETRSYFDKLTVCNEGVEIYYEILRILKNIKVLFEYRYDLNKFNISNQCPDLIFSFDVLRFK